LRVLLQQHPGWEICGEASTGSEALQKTIELKPDVLVKDWVMPRSATTGCLLLVAFQMTETS
jgi:DNA-binding NarL/FixJ family response regulator